MSGRVDMSGGVSSRARAGFIELQYEQAIETFRTYYSWLTQVTTVLVIANATVVGFGVTTQIAGILLIGALFPIMILYVGYRTFKLMLPAVYTAVSVECRYGGAEGDWLMSTFLSTAISAEYVAGLRDIIFTEDPAERAKRLYGASPPVIWRRSLWASLVLVAVGQVIAPIVLCVVFHWRLI